MDMESMEEVSGSNDHTMIMKGKRTKRQRPPSPAGRATSSSSSGGGGGRGEKSGCSDGGDLNYNSMVPSSSEISTSTEEDEDMANCLILLAQGGCSIKQEEEEEIKMEKFSSRRVFNEMVTTTTANKAGFYVYECKTCNRTFPSFQALGGHRASHKKPKPMVEEKKVIATISVHPEEEEEEEEGKQFNKPNDSPQSMELSNKASHGNNNKSKIHECSICGSEFSSGQALGGHMRRHRNPTTTRTTIDDHSEKPPRSIFPLDLNLPAPEDHDHRDLKFQYAANQQHLVLSAPALVDCHY